jgi:hypothetical protein
MDSISPTSNLKASLLLIFGPDDRLTKVAETGDLCAAVHSRGGVKR